jgi:hypothetical protein
MSESPVKTEITRYEHDALECFIVLDKTSVGNYNLIIKPRIAGMTGSTVYMGTESVKELVEVLSQAGLCTQTET